MPNVLPMRGQTRRIRRIFLAGAVLIVMLSLLVWLAWPGKGNNFAAHKLRVVAAENFWGDIAKQIGGDAVQVASFVNDPSTDPHLYESNANNAASMASAQVVIVNGLGYDDFMNKLLAAAPATDREVVTAADVVGAKNNANPHLWYKLAYVQSVAGAIELAYEQADVAHTDTYRRNLLTFNMSLDALYKSETEIKSHYSGTAVAYTERVPGYLLDDVGLVVKTPPGFAEAIENGNDPSPGDTQALETVLAQRQVYALLYNAQATSVATQAIRSQALQAKIPIVGVTETLPAGATFQQWQQGQLDKLLAALETK